jgi:hypothetical protein
LDRVSQISVAKMLQGLRSLDRVSRMALAPSIQVSERSPNEVVAKIHDRIFVILAPADYARWLGKEPDPRDPTPA